MNRLWLYIAIVIVGIVGLCAWWVDQNEVSAPKSTVAVNISPVVAGQKTHEYYCGKCHKLPPPEILSRDQWSAAIKYKAFKLLPDLGVDLTNEEVKNIIAYYQSHSPIKLPELAADFTPSPIKFDTAPLISNKLLSPFIVNINIVDLDQDGQLDVLSCDTEATAVIWTHRVGSKWNEDVLGFFKSGVPVHTEVFDSDDDGDLDIVVSNIGRLEPTDDLIGEVVLLRQTRPGEFEAQSLVKEIGRVSDARPVDFDRDGDIDYVIAMFGWRTSGGIGWLEQKFDGTYAFHRISSKHGTVNVPIVDLNNDGRMDFVALVAKEFEQIIAYINVEPDVFDNRGSVLFKPYLLYEGPHPMFGSTGINLVDIDQDGDQDVLYTNGDALGQDLNPKPYHGVQWLENLGDLKFRYHDIARFYGAVSAIAGDIDRDGDIDIVAASVFNDWRKEERQSLIWLSNDGEQNFTRHNLANMPTHLSISLGDINGDGLPDIVGGTNYNVAELVKPGTPFSYPPQERYSQTGLTLWTNQGRLAGIQ